MSGLARGGAVFAFMLLSLCAATWLTPAPVTANRGASLEQLVPREFPGWVEDRADAIPVNLNLPGAFNAAAGERATYDEILMRTYRRSDGQRVMLAIAYGRTQSQELKIHRPELCYAAQGFEVRRLGTRAVRLSPDRSVDSVALLTRNRSRIEVVTYWIRIGGQITQNAWQTRWTIFRAGLGGALPDGLMMRASSLAAAESQTDQALALQQTFLADLYRQVPPGTRRLLAGG